MSKHMCKSCLHCDVCEWVVQNREIICDDFLDTSSYEEGYSDGYLQGMLDYRHNLESRGGKE